MNLIVGLGNPGREYSHNRHNTGYRCIDYLAKLHSIRVSARQSLSLVGTGQIAGCQVVLAKPKTYVNLSGKAVYQLTKKYKVPLSSLIVIYDDLDLPPGRIRLRRGGGTGGHNGMKSIFASLKDKDFLRVRIGIGRPEDRQHSRYTDDDIVDHVLGDFTPEEETVIATAIARAAEAVEIIVSEGIDAAMNRYNLTK